MSQTSNSSEKPQAAARSETQVSKPHSANLTIALAAGLGVSFFLPWVRFLGMTRSLFDAAKRGGTDILYWALPVSCALTIFAAATNRSPKAAAQLAGALPFIILAHAFYEHGDRLMRMLDIGAFVGAGLGLVLFFLQRNLK